MQTRWDVETAVLQSRLVPYARLIVFALLSKTDSTNAVIPADQSPSLTGLQAMTGLSRSAVTEWLDALERAGWVQRMRPATTTGYERTRYSLHVGCPEAERARNRIPDELREAVYRRDGFRCLRCGAVEDLSLDHVVPRSCGGADTYENLQTLCVPCNSWKATRTLDFASSGAVANVS